MRVNDESLKTQPTKNLTYKKTTLISLSDNKSGSPHVDSRCREE